MSLPAAIATIVVLDIALLGFLAWMMSHPRRLTPHVSAHEKARQPEFRWEHETQSVTPRALYE